MKYELEDYLKNYEVYPDGSVYSHYSNKFIKSVDNGRGYIKYNLHYQGSKKTVYMHRLIALMFIDNPENKAEVNHINGITTDNRIENLEWVTPSENVIHSKRYLSRGYVKLTVDDVIKIRKLYADGMRICDITKLYPVHQVTIGNIVHNRKWKM